METDQEEMAETPEVEKSEAPEGGVDLDAIRAKMAITPDVKPVYEKALLSGRRLMFSKETAKQNSEFLNGPGPMAKKLADGVVAVVYMLWKRSNQTLNPKVIVPVTFALTLDAFEFIQEANHPEATPETLGQAVEMSTETILQKFGVPPDKIEQFVKKNAAAVEGGQSAEAGPAAGAEQARGILGGKNG